MSGRVALNRIALRAFSQQTSATKPPTGGSVNPSVVKADVPGLSSNVVRKRAGPLGPGADTTGGYKVPEYFCYDQTSFAEAEVELAKYRCPQPSALKK